MTSRCTRARSVGSASESRSHGEADRIRAVRGAEAAEGVREEVANGMGRDAEGGADPGVAVAERDAGHHLALARREPLIDALEPCGGASHRARFDRLAGCVGDREDRDERPQPGRLLLQERTGPPKERDDGDDPAAEHEVCEERAAEAEDPRDPAVPALPRLRAFRERVSIARDTALLEREVAQSG